MTPIAKKRSFAGLAVLTALAVPGLAQFAVVDVSSIAQEIQEVQWLSQQYQTAVSQYQQLISTYTMITSQYNQMVANAKGLGNLPKAFIAPFTRWRMPAAANQYGTSNAWVQALLGSGNAQSGYQAATIPLIEFTWNNISPDAQAVDQLKYSTVELTDGISENSMSMVGSVRANANTAQTAIAQLESQIDANGADPSEVEALQAIGSGNVIALRNQQDSNALLASLVETMTLSQKAQRDAMASSVANEIAFANNAGPDNAAMFAGTIDALNALGVLP